MTLEGHRITTCRVYTLGAMTAWAKFEWACTCGAKGRRQQNPQEALSGALLRCRADAERHLKLAVREEVRA